MQGLCARLNDVRGVPTLLMGSLSTQKEYRNPDTGAWEKAGPEVRQAYQRAVKTLKRRLVDDPAGKGYPLGPAALELLRQGQAELKTTVLPGRRG